MKNPAMILTVFSIILVLCASFAGCSGNEATETPPQPTTTTAAPAFSAGDIVQDSPGSSSIGWLIISYDSATDSYTRALVNKKADGTWGYRPTGKTETAKRAAMEAAYTRVTMVSVSSIPIGIPTTVTTVATTTITTAATTTVATTATTAGVKPVIKDIDPEEGTEGQTISVVITGSNFKEGATVKLVHSGESDIEGTNVVLSSATQISCKFVLPSGSYVPDQPAWDIVVTNPDSTSVTWKKYFIIHGKSS